MAYTTIDVSRDRYFNTKFFIPESGGGQQSTLQELDSNQILWVKASEMVHCLNHEDPNQIVIRGGLPEVRYQT